MMYDHENLSPAIVAVKPTNKAGQPAAELVEPRAGPRGRWSAKHGPGTVPGDRVTGAGAHRKSVRISRRAVTYPRWETCARIGLARTCAGGAR